MKIDWTYQDLIKNFYANYGQGYHKSQERDK